MIEQLHRVKASTRAAFVLLLAVVTVLLVTPPPDDVAAQPASENVWLTQRRILNMAHGGGLAEAPQGTLYAYKTAAARGANALEMDLHMTLDGHVVAIHDSTVDRTTNGTGCVVSKTLAELKALDAAYTFVPGEGPVSGRPAEDYTMRGIATGSVTPPAGFTANDFTIATLEEIFQAVPDAYMIMELKPTEVYQSHDCPAFLESLPPDQRPDLAAAVAALIDQYGMADKVLVASFIDDLLSRFQSFAPDVDTSFPLGESLAVYQAFLAGDPLPNPNGHEAFQVPRAYGPITITKEIVDYARANDVAVHFWTINDPDEMNELLDWGVDGLITDVPQVLSPILDERGEPQPAVASTTELIDPPGASKAGDAVTFTAAVYPEWPWPEAAGAVELLVDDEVRGTAAVTQANATFTITDLAVGTHVVTARFTGSARVLASTSSPVSHEVIEGDSPTTSTTAVPSSTATDPSAAVAGEQAESARPSTGTLPTTGSGLKLFWVALALVGAGVVLLVVRRLAGVSSSTNDPRARR